MPDLPQPLPAFDATAAEIARWVSEALPEHVAATWRPSHSEHAPLVVRFANGREVFFDTIADACRPERFRPAVIAVTGRSMTAYSRPQTEVIVAALVRMATISDELDERDHWADLGATFLRTCLRPGMRTIVLEPEPEDEPARLALYRGVLRYEAYLGTRPDGVPPRALVAVDVGRERLLVPRGAFLEFVNRRRRSTSPAAVAGQMRRLAWRPLDLRPRKPGNQWETARRPHLRLWELDNGWDGLAVEIKDGKVVEIASDRGPAVPRGPAEHARTRATPPEAGPHGTAGPLFGDQEPVA